MIAKAKAQAAIHTKRLLRLADILEKLRDGNGRKGTTFDMDIWGKHEGDHKPSFREGFCGTAACALGHAAMDKQFHKDGLRIKFTEYSWGMFDKQYFGTVTFNGLYSEYAGAAFFGLRYPNSEDEVFLKPQTKRQVITKLRKLAKTRQELRSL